MTRLYAPDAPTRDASRGLVASLPDGELKLNGTDTPLPEPVATMLREMLARIGEGEPVVLVTQDSEMTPNEAADMLNVSRGYVLKLMDEGKLPFRTVGFPPPPSSPTSCAKTPLLMRP